MRIGIIGAMQVEIENLQKYMSDKETTTVSGVNFITGKIDGTEIVAAVCGVGKVFAAICAEAMILKFDVDKVINIGVAGSVTSDLKVLDVVVADKVVQHDMNTTAIGDPMGLLSGINKVYLESDKELSELVLACAKEKNVNALLGTIATGDLFVDTPKQRSLINERYGALAAEMEGGSIGHVCYVNKVPFAILRSISDAEGSSMDFATFAGKAAEQSIEIIVDVIKKLN